jgi:hypothetical protein
MIIAAQLILLAVLMLWAFWSGYTVGIRDTEERWSDAVQRKHDSDGTL